MFGTIWEERKRNGENIYTNDLVYAVENRAFLGMD